MFKKIAIISLLFSSTAFAQDLSPCKIEFAVASNQNQYVAFNVTIHEFLNRSITLNSNNSPQIMDDLPCTDNPYQISATPYSFSNTLKLFSLIGTCSLKQPFIYLKNPNDSASVVFPYDFNC